MNDSSKIYFCTAKSAKYKYLHKFLSSLAMLTFYRNSHRYFFKKLGHSTCCITVQYVYKKNSDPMTFIEETFQIIVCL